MVKITYGELRSGHFRTTMQKLSNCSAYEDHKVAYNIMRMAKTLEVELTKTNKEFSELTDKYCVKHANGALKVTEDKADLVWTEGTDPVLAKKAIEDFDKKEVVIDRYKLKLDDLAPAKLTPADMAAIDPLVTAGLEAVPS